MNPVAEPKDSSSDVGLDVEPVAAKVQSPPELCTKDLKAGFHVGDVAIEQEVGDEGYELIAHHEPEAVSSLAAETAHPVHGVGASFYERLQQDRIVAGVVFQVGVLNQRELPGRFRNGPTDRRPFALVDLLAQRPDARVAARGRGSNLPGAVGRTVVDDNHLTDFWPLQDVLENDVERALFVEGRDHDGQDVFHSEASQSSVGAPARRTWLPRTVLLVRQ